MISPEMIATRQLLESREFMTAIIKEFATNGVEQAVNLAQTFLVRKGITRDKGYVISVAYVVGIVHGAAFLTEKKEAVR